MNKESLLYGAVGVLGGSLLTLLIATSSVNSNNNGMMRIMGMHTNQSTSSVKDDSMGMDDMMSGLKGKTGDNFDKAFLSEMIVHHQGAIDMATLAKLNAKHDEIKKLADDIVAAQTKEINEMKQWQKDWGYPTGDSSMGGMRSGH